MSEPSNAEILDVLFSDRADDERVILCSVPGDPNTVERWPGLPWGGGRNPVHPMMNNYATVSTFRANDEGRYKRRKDQFGALCVIMVDDIGTKIDPTRLPNILRPTMLVETSPGNYQATFKLRAPQADQELADGLIKRMIQVLAVDGIDPGMAGVTRVFRLPGGINGKPKYQDHTGAPWRCKLARWRPDVTMDFDELAQAFSLVRQYRQFVEPADSTTLERKRGFGLVMDCLTALGRVRRKGRGWVDITCPWVDEHTDKADTGAAVAYPEQKNGYYGGYRCHHGHCQGRGWGDLEDWVTDAIIDHGERTRGLFSKLIIEGNT